MKKSVRTSAGRLYAEIRSLIEAARSRVAQSVNSGLVMLYWQIGDRLRREVIGPGRAEYGQRVVETLAHKLSAQFGHSFSRTNLFNMIRFAEVLPHRKIVHTLSGQLSWSHVRLIIYEQHASVLPPSASIRFERSAIRKRTNDASCCSRLVRFAARTPPFALIPSPFFHLPSPFSLIPFLTGGDTEKSLKELTE